MKCFLQNYLFFIEYHSKPVIQTWFFFLPEGLFLASGSPVNELWAKKKAVG